MNLVAIEGSCKRQGTGIGGGGRCICRGDGIVIINEGSRGRRKELVFGDEVGSLTGRNKRMPSGWFIIRLDDEMLLGLLAFSGRLASCFAVRDGTSCGGWAGSWMYR